MEFPDIIIKEGQVSPHNGVLLSPGAYRLDTSYRLKYQELQSNLDTLTKCDSFCVGVPVSGVIEIVIITVLISTLGTLYFVHR